MKRVALSLVLVAGMAASSAMAADMATKAPPAAAPPPSPWDVAITAALMTDYNFRGITQSAHHPSTQATFEPRYNFSSTLQGYVGISGESIDFPNRAAAEIDLYGGIRPTFDKLALDFGIWEYWYPGGQCYNSALPASCQPTLNNGNVVVQNESFYEAYAKATYTINDNWSVEGQFYYSPNVVGSGAPGEYYTGNVTYTAPSTWFTNGLGAYASADIGWWQLGTSSAFYGFTPYTSYANWDAGIGFTYKAFTLDLRYYDTNLNQGDCNSFTSDHTAPVNGSVTAINPGGQGSSWCSAAYIAKLTFQTNLSSLK